MSGKDALRKKIERAAGRAAELKPLVPSVTNTVTQGFVADAQLAAGGSAVMVNLPDEACSLAEKGRAFYINLGTVLPVYERTVPQVLERLKKNSIPWVLDPVGTGFGELRTGLFRLMRDFSPSVIRGNASEIISLARLWGLLPGKSPAFGVDSADRVEEACEAAACLAGHTGGAVAVSGERDLVTDGRRLAFCTGGSPFFTGISGSGCSLGGVTAVFAAVAEPFVAAMTAVQAYNCAGERAARRSASPAMFKSCFLEELYLLQPVEVAAQPFELEERESYASQP